MIPNYLLCTADDCDKIKAVCAGCYSMNPKTCVSHTKQERKHASASWRDVYRCMSDGRVYCDKCLRKVLCVKCGLKTVPQPWTLPSGPDQPNCASDKASVGWCKAQTDLCEDCGDFKPSMKCRDEGKRPTQYEYLLCPLCYQREIQAQKCSECSTVSRTKYWCKCCDRQYCDKCNPQMCVDISPITLYGSGLSVCHYEYYCSTCTDGMAEVDIQNSYRNTGDYSCAMHSTTDGQLDVASYIVCTEYTKPNGLVARKITLYGHDKRCRIDVNTEQVGIYEYIKAYCSSHPEKVAAYDGKSVTFPTN